MMIPNDRGKKQRHGIIAILFCAFLISLSVLIIDRFSLLGKTNAGENDGELKDSDYSPVAVTLTTEWSYLDSGDTPKAGNLWTTDSYDMMEGWKSGRGIFAGVNSKEKDKANVTIYTKTALRPAAATCFFRTTFLAEDIVNVKSIEGKIRYKSAAIVYLNGKIVFAGNVPGGGYESNGDFGTAADYTEVQEASFLITDLSSLKEGKNVLSVELHQGQNGVADGYMEFSKFSLSDEEIDEKPWPLDGIFFMERDEKQQTRLVWVTDREGFYQVEYGLASQYDKEKNIFNGGTQSLILGKTPDYGDEYNSSDDWIHKVTLTNLRSDTQYAYIIKEVGKSVGSEPSYFSTPSKKMVDKSD